MRARKHIKLRIGETTARKKKKKTIQQTAICFQSGALLPARKKKKTDVMFSLCFIFTLFPLNDGILWRSPTFVPSKRKPDPHFPLNISNNLRWCDFSGNFIRHIIHMVSIFHRFRLVFISTDGPFRQWWPDRIWSLTSTTSCRRSIAWFRYGIFATTKTARYANVRFFFSRNDANVDPIKVFDRFPAREPENSLQS